MSAIPTDNIATAPASPFKINWGIINGLRGLAALYVVIHHSRHALFGTAEQYAEVVTPKADWGWWEWLNIIIMQQTNLGVEFVTLFFVLSGFSIAHSVANKPAIGGFYLRRFIRLYPTYILGLVWAILMYMVIKFGAPEVYYTDVAAPRPLQHNLMAQLEPLNLIKTLLYMPHDNYLIMQYWSLPLEVLFYIIAPFVIMRLRWYAIVTMLAYVVGIYLYGISYQHLLGFIPFQFTFDFGIYFLVGILFYKYKERLISTYKLNRTGLLIAACIIFELLVVAKAYVWGNVENKGTGWIMVLFTYILLFGLLKHSVRINFLEKIGAYSYTLYVTHMATIHIICVIFWNIRKEFYHINIMPVWYLGVFSSLLVAYSLFWVAEYPSTKFLEKWRKSYTAKKV